MLLTQKQTYRCSACTQEYRGIEGIKHNSRTGEERVVWKKVKIGGVIRTFPPSGKAFDCLVCGEEIPV